MEGMMILKIAYHHDQVTIHRIVSKRISITKRSKTKKQNH